MILIIGVLGILAFGLMAQSGGQYEIQKTTIATGGGAVSGGQFSVSITVGQTIAGVNSTNPPFGLNSGFWQASFAPTSAPVSVSGRVMTPRGIGLVNATVTLTNSSGTVVAARSSSFGYFRFDDITAGQTYILSVNSRRFTFASLVINVADHISDLELVALY